MTWRDHTQVTVLLPPQPAPPPAPREPAQWGVVGAVLAGVVLSHAAAGIAWFVRWGLS